MLAAIDDQKGGGLPQKGRGYAIAAGILGWTLDAFDFFVVVFLVDTLAGHFQVGKSAIVLSIGATLAMRPVGALLFGTLADRYGRRKPLMAVVAYFSLIEVLSGLSPTYPIFLVLRLLYGIGMEDFGELVRHSLWRAHRDAGGACFPACYRADTRWVICLLPWRRD